MDGVYGLGIREPLFSWQVFATAATSNFTFTFTGRRVDVVAAAALWHERIRTHRGSSSPRPSGHIKDSARQRATDV